MRKISNKKKNIFSVILARSGSKSIKNKNLQMIKNKPLVAWAIEACKKSKLIQSTFFCTDSKTYGNIAKKYGIKDIIYRPRSLSLDSTSDLETIRFALKKIKELGKKPNIIAHIRPTTPFRKIKILDNAIKKFLKNKKATSLRTVHEMPETAYKSYEIDKKKNRLTCLKNLKINIELTNFPKQKFNKTYMANGIVDIYRSEIILKKNKLLGNNPTFFLTEYTQEIDSLEQLRYLRYLSKNKKIVS